MAKRKYFPTMGMTPEQVKEFYLEKAKAKFGDKFDYSKVGIVTKSSDEIVVTCPNHGDIKTSFSVHLGSATGCFSCGRESSQKSRRFSHKEFLNKVEDIYGEVDWVLLNKYTHNSDHMYLQDKYGMHKMRAKSMFLGNTLTIRSAIDKTEYTINRFIEKHGNRYDYSSFEYKTAKSDSTIICKKHGGFRRSANDHLNGCGCPKCKGEEFRERIMSNTEDFINKAKPVHNGFFSYDKVDYKSAIEKVTITCPLHGDFEQTPNSHLHGYGCYDCSRLGFKRDELDIDKAKKIKCYLYLIKLSNKDETFYKVGISRRPKKRFYDLKRHGFNLEKVQMVFGNLLDSVTIESKVLREFKCFKYMPVTEMHGYTECFTKDLPIKEVKQYIEELKNIK